MATDLKPIAIDLFAGAGGFSLAAKRAGMDLRLAVEIDRHACQTYRQNLIGSASTPILVEHDIRNIDWDRELHQAEIGTGECSILLGGPPCQGYSAHRIKDAGVGDPRNDLLLAYFDCLDRIKPRAFLVENVPGILWPRHAEYLEKFIDSAQCEYSVFDPIALNARDYGVPQNRKRIFILGIRKDLAGVAVNWPPPRSHYSPTSTEVLEEGKKAWITASTVFDKPIRKSDPMAIHMNHGAELIAVFKKTPPNGGSRRDSGRVLECHRKHDGHKDVYGRIDPKGPGPTMTTACINPSKGRFVHPTEHHGICARHAARFQTFPEDFNFEGGLIAAGQQIGNAVPVVLGTKLIRHIVTALGRAKL